jgi:hypothetical protein
VHSGIGNFFNHQNGVVRTFVDGDAAAAALLAAAGGGAVAADGDAAGDDTEVGGADIEGDEQRTMTMRRKCSKCGNYGHRADGKRCPNNNVQ